MRDPQNEVTCPSCGATHYSYPHRHCRDCRDEMARSRADYRRQVYKEGR